MLEELKDRGEEQIDLMRKLDPGRWGMISFKNWRRQKGNICVC